MFRHVFELSYFFSRFEGVSFLGLFVCSIYIDSLLTIKGYRAAGFSFRWWSLGGEAAEEKETPKSWEKETGT